MRRSVLRVRALGKRYAFCLFGAFRARGCHLLDGAVHALFGACSCSAGDAFLAANACALVRIKHRGRHSAHLLDHRRQDFERFTNRANKLVRGARLLLAGCKLAHSRSCLRQGSDDLVELSLPSEHGTIFGLCACNCQGGKKKKGRQSYLLTDAPRGDRLGV